MHTQPCRLENPLRLTPGNRLILLGIAGGVALLIWLLSSAAVSPAPTPEADSQNAPAAGNVSARENCPECGVVSATRGIAESAPGIIPGIEVTVRMRDGSNRRFVDTSSANWRVGERMMIINSDKPTSD